MESKIHNSTSFKVQALIDGIGTRLQKPITPKTFHRLITQLDDAHRSCHDEKLHSQISDLYGRLVREYNCFIEKEVSLLKELAKSSSCNHLSLKERIEKMKTSDGIYREHLESLLEIEKGILSTEKPKDVFMDEAEELFSLASFIYHGETDNEQAALKELSSLAQKHLLKHTKKNMSRIQSVFAAAYELGGLSNEKYPEKQEIDLFFKERESIILQDEASTHIKKPSIARFARPA